MKRRSFNQSDRIRLNIRWLNERFHTQSSIIEHTFSTCPMLPLCIAFIAGIIIADSPGITFWFLTCLAVLCSAGLLASFRFSTKVKTYLIFLCAASLFFGLGAARTIYIRQQPPVHISHYLGNDRPRELATLRGIVRSQILVNQSKGGFSSIPWLNSQCSFYLSVSEVKTSSGWQKARGNVRVQIAEPGRHLRPGNTVQIYCWLSRFSPPANPGQFDLQKHMHRRGVFVAASVPIAEGVEIIDSDSSLLFRLRSLFYHFAADNLLDETVTDPDVQSLTSALLLGQRSNLDPAIVAAFQKTNLAHFISLSGMHVGILAGSLWILLRTSQIPKRPRAVLCITLLVIYALIVPPRAATMRAVFLSCFFFASTLLHRRTSPINTLALSAVVLLFARPYDLFSAGWQLSFLSVLGILVFYRPVQYHLMNRFFYPLILLFKDRFMAIQHFLYDIIELLAVGISAWIVIAPMLLYYFGRINPLSPLWTVLVLPAVLVILYAGFAKIVLAPLLPTLASLLGLILNMAAHLLEKAVVLLSKTDILQFASHRPGVLFICLLYLLLAVAFFLPYRYVRCRKLLLSLLLVCFLFPFISRKAERVNETTIKMTCLSVGHGQAIIVSGPSGQHFLFDAGSITNQDIARKTIAPFLQHRSIFDLDAIYLSHGDLDHINAVPDIAAAVPVKHIFANSALLENAKQPSLEQQLSTRLEELGLRFEPIGDGTYDRLTINSLWPPPDIASDNSITENDRSEILLLNYAGRKILLCGDVEKPAQNQFLQMYPALKVDVMVLPHHGSTTNLNAVFIEQLDPEILIASCSAKNIATIYRPVENSNRDVFYTAVDGTVTVKIKADGTLRAVGFLTINN